MLSYHPSYEEATEEDTHVLRRKSTGSRVDDNGRSNRYSVDSNEHQADDDRGNDSDDDDVGGKTDSSKRRMTTTTTITTTIAMRTITTTITMTTMTTMPVN